MIPGTANRFEISGSALINRPESPDIQFCGPNSGRLDGENPTDIRRPEFGFQVQLGPVAELNGKPENLDGGYPRIAGFLVSEVITEKIMFMMIIKVHLYDVSKHSVLEVEMIRFVVQKLRWEFIRENKKVRKIKKTRSRPRKKK